MTFVARPEMRARNKRGQSIFSLSPALLQYYYALPPFSGPRWVQWNVEHATRHGVSVAECERIVRSRRYRETGDGKCRAVGRGSGGRWLQVVFSLTEEDEVFVIQPDH